MNMVAIGGSTSE